MSGSPSITFLCPLSCIKNEVSSFFTYYSLHFSPVPSLLLRRVPPTLFRHNDSHVILSILWWTHFLSNYKFKVFSVFCWIDLADVNRNIRSGCIWALHNHKQILTFRITVNALPCKKLPEFDLRVDNHVTTPIKISADGPWHKCHCCMLHRADLLQLKLGGGCKDISRRSLNCWPGLI